MPPKLWHWEYFQVRAKDQSKGAQKDYHGKNSTFINTWCRACIEKCISALRQEDNDARVRGIISAVQDPGELLEHALTIERPIPGRRDGFEKHIRDCKVIDVRVKAHLSAEATPSHPDLLEDSRQSKGLWVANGWSWNSINNPQTRMFFDSWRPEAKLPDRHKLSGAVLDGEVETANTLMREASCFRRVSYPYPQGYLTAWIILPQ
ncbi:hypothetical protein BDV93DRAFT_576932 [Ceratobasidium sp. AG-I]|nr:hypothetical protein BDV93DRAFT_576932 [Ceratobasidium sp. AG-I]